MLTLAIIAMGILLLAGLTALFHATGHAPEGWEDPLGFHEGPAGRPPEILLAATPVARRSPTVRDDRKVPC